MDCQKSTRTASSWCIRAAAVSIVVAAAAASAAFVFPALRSVDLLPLGGLRADTRFLGAFQPVLEHLLPFGLAAIDTMLLFAWFAWLVGMVTRSAMRWQDPHLPAAIRPHGRGRILFVVLLATLTIPCTCAFVLAQRNRGSAADEKVFRSRCSRCHAYQAPLVHAKTDHGWGLTVDRMRAKSPDHMSAADAEAAKRYLRSVRGLSGERLFEAKCQTCHALSLESQHRSLAQWKRIVFRMGSFNEFWLPRTEQQQILEYIAAHMPGGRTAAPAAEEPARLDLEVTCVQCHTLDVIFRPPPDADWPEIVGRMKAKAPWLELRSGERGLADWIARQVKDPDGFGHEFPHNSRYLFADDAPP